MAINYSAYNAGSGMVTEADEYAGQAAMRQDIQQDIQQGMKFGQELVDRQDTLRKNAQDEAIKLAQEMRAAESHDVTMSLQRLNLRNQEKAIEEAQEANDFYDQELINALEPTVGISNENSNKNDVCVEGNVISGQSASTDGPCGESNDVEVKTVSGTPVYKGGKYVGPKKDKETFINAINTFRSNMPANTEVANNFLSSPGIDKDPNSEVMRVATAVNKSGYKRGDYNPATKTFDAIVTTPNGEVVIPGGDFNAYFKNKSVQDMSMPSIINSIGKDTDVIADLIDGKDVAPSRMNSLLPVLELQFQDTDKLDAFRRQVHENNKLNTTQAYADAVSAKSPGGTEITAEEASLIALGGIRAIYDKQIKNPPKEEDEEEGPTDTVKNIEYKDKRAQERVDNFIFSINDKNPLGDLPLIVQNKEFNGGRILGVDDTDDGIFITIKGSGSIPTQTIPNGNTGYTLEQYKQQIATMGGGKLKGRVELTDLKTSRR